MPTLDGTKTLRVAPGTTHGTVQRLRGEGPPKLGSGSPPARGDIHYRFVIDVPEELDQGAAGGRRRALEGHERRPARAAVRERSRGEAAAEEVLMSVPAAR